MSAVIDKILYASPTLSTYLSQETVVTMFLRGDWRCYSPNTYDADLTTLAERFVTYHARVPGMISPEVKASHPTNIFFWEANDTIYRGGTFLNGAILHVAHKDSEESKLSLFISDATARQHGYPDKGYVILPELYKDTQHQEEQ